MKLIKFETVATDAIVANTGFIVNVDVDNLEINIGATGTTTTMIGPFGTVTFTVDGASNAEINDETTGGGFLKAANDCDDDITTTGSSTEDSFTLNGEFSSNEEPQRILEHMLSACGGHLTYNNGQFSLFVGKGRTASGTITDDKVLAPIQITTKASGMATANGVKATYVRPSDDYIGGEITPYKDSTFLTEDTPSGEASAND